MAIRTSLTLRALAFAFLSVIATVCFGEGSSVANENLRDALQRYAHFLGWNDGTGRLRSYLLIGRNASFERTVYHVDVQRRVTTTVNSNVNGLSSAMVVSSRGPYADTWRQLTNGLRVTSSAWDAQQLVTQAALFDGELFDSALVSKSFIGDHPSIRVHIPHGRDVDVAFDDNGRLIDAVIDPEGIAAKYHFLKFTTLADNRAVPVEWTVNGVEQRYDSVSENIPTVDLPTPVPSASLNASTWSPLSFTPQGVPVVNATIDGKPAKLLLDSGSSELYVSSALLNRVPQELIGTLQATINSKITSIRVFRLSNIKVGNIALPEVKATENDALVVPGTDGTLGLPLFAAGRVSIDFREGRFSISPSSRAVENGRRVAIDTFYGVAITDGSLSQRESQMAVRTLIDTGRWDSAVIPSSVVRSRVSDLFCGKSLAIIVADVSIPAAVDCALRDLMVSRHLSTSAMVSGRSLTSGTLIFDYGQHAMWVIP